MHSLFRWSVRALQLLVVFFVAIALSGTSKSGVDAAHAASSLYAHAVVESVEADPDCPNYDYSNWPQCLDS
jgi:hypothetical protein